eukprot:SAG22_NODE_6_length_41368_cov_49.702222_12_plen_186_part_00
MGREERAEAEAVAAGAGAGAGAGASDDAAAAGPLPRVKCETTVGDFTLELDRSQAPLGFDRFMQLVDDKENFFEDMLLYRTIKGFLVQFGWVRRDMKGRERARDGESGRGRETAYPLRRCLSPSLPASLAHALARLAAHSVASRPALTRKYAGNKNIKDDPHLPSHAFTKGTLSFAGAGPNTRSR